MLFNTPAFLLFLPLVFAAYWAMNRWTGERGELRAQNLLLLIASYVFYGWWDWRFLGLIAFSTAVDYAVGLQIARANAADRPDDPDHRSRLRCTHFLGHYQITVPSGISLRWSFTNSLLET